MDEGKKNCLLCPRGCRTQSYCTKAADAKAEVALFTLHKFEEPFISGGRGSGTVFFARCPLKCVYCQNHKISRGEKEFEKMDSSELAEVFLRLELDGAHNINLVSPTHYSFVIIPAVAKARKEGLKVPIVYNTSGYERPQIIDALKNTVDIYLTDFKYYDNAYAAKYSACPDYFEYASAALKKMSGQTGAPVFDADGMLKKGVVVRHLTLPGLLPDSKRVLNYLYSAFKDDIIISIMNQYTPTAGLDKEKYPELNKPVSKKQYSQLIDYASAIGITNALVQEGGTVDESFIPLF